MRYYHNIISWGTVYRGEVMKKTLSFLCILLCAALISATFAFGCPVSAAGDDAADMIERFRRETGCDSVSAVIYNKGDISYYGDNDALYQIGSMTKAFTGLAVQQLTEQGLINGNDLVSDHLEGFEAYYNGERADITITDLMAQKSGYTNSETDYPSANEGMTLSEWVMTISGKELKCAPGTEYNYSNVNYDLLGAVIESVTGSTYAEYMQNEVFAPLGLEDTYASVPDSTRITEGTRLGYRQTFVSRIPVREASIPAGYIYSDTEDMAKWMQFWLGDSKNMGTARAGILSMVNEDGSYYAGWENFGDRTGHSGGTPNYSSRIVFSEEEQIGVCVLTDLNVAVTTDSLCNSLFDITAGKGGGKLATDVWTVFDIVFTIVSVICLALLAVIIRTKKNGVLIASWAVLILLLAAIIIVFPSIFGAGINDILFTWAPWSVAGGIAFMAADTAAAIIKLLFQQKERKALMV